jgi:hypothetical protein
VISLMQDLHDMDEAMCVKLLKAVVRLNILAAN